MIRRLPETLPRLILCILLASGLLLPVLGMLDLLSFSFNGLLAIILFSLLLELVSVHRSRLLLFSAVLLLLFLIWLFLLNGLRLISDILLAVSLSFSGAGPALSLVADQAVTLFTVPLVFFSFLFTRKKAGCIPALLSAVLMLLMLWLSDRADLLLLFTPSAISAFALILASGNSDSADPKIILFSAFVILLSYLVFPHGGIVSPELKKTSENFRQSVLDRLFFTEPRDVFSLSSYGYYPEGSHQLGGPVELSGTPVMQVSTPSPVYLRGVILNEYDGRYWKNTLGGRRYLWQSRAMIPGKETLFDMRLPSETLSASLNPQASVSCRMLSGSASTLFLPQRIRDLRTGGDLVPYYSASSEVFVTRNLQPGDTWTVSALLTVSGIPGLNTLISAAENTRDDQWEQIRDTYLTLPGHLEEPLWLLSEDITAMQKSPYEKAMALQNYLSRNFRYRLDVSPQSPNVDFVTSFLFETKEGYCTYFASAMTVLSRMAGLPARYVEGFLANPDETGNASVTGDDAHAWTEIYFKGFGWLTFDATPRRSSAKHGGVAPDREETAGPTSEPDNSPVSPSPSPEPSLETEDSFSSPSPASGGEQSTPSSGNDSLPPESISTPEPQPSEASFPPDDNSPGYDSFAPFPWWILFLLLAVCTASWRWIRTSPERKAKKAADDTARFDIWSGEISTLLLSRGYRRNTGETPISFTRRLDRTAGLTVSLSSYGECLSLIRYSQAKAVDTDVILARTVALSIRKSLNTGERIRYILRRFFSVPGSKAHCPDN